MCAYTTVKTGIIETVLSLSIFSWSESVSIEKVAVRENWLACAQYCALLEKLDFVSEITSVME